LTYDFIDGVAVDQLDDLEKMNLSLKDVSYFLLLLLKLILIH